MATFVVERQRRRGLHRRPLPTRNPAIDAVLFSAVGGLPGKPRAESTAPLHAHAGGCGQWSWRGRHHGDYRRPTLPLAGRRVRGGALRDRAHGPVLGDTDNGLVRAAPLHRPSRQYASRCIRQRGRQLASGADLQRGGVGRDRHRRHGNGRHRDLDGPGPQLGTCGDGHRARRVRCTSALAATATVIGALYYYY
jgi:hypothetical protein